jgi:hypothetical protein
MPTARDNPPMAQCHQGRGAQISGGALLQSTTGWGSAFQCSVATPGGSPSQLRHQGRSLISTRIRDPKE